MAKAEAKVIFVKVHPRARREKVEQHGPDRFEVWTTAPPDKGKANDAVCKLLGNELGLAPSRLVLVRGASSREKVFEVQ
ncbi:MAG: DUF167 domain-containing protein [Candidatus Sumerlaeaceae bacterium]|jgi:uncharacterized protein (TIGR00251 family)